MRDRRSESELFEEARVFGSQYEVPIVSSAMNTSLLEVESVLAMLTRSLEGEPVWWDSVKTQCDLRRRQRPHGDVFGPSRGGQRIFKLRQRSQADRLAVDTGGIALG
jgi:hypothetical protein